MSVVPGTRLGPYSIVSKLGEGGIGEVYRGTDTRLGREAAIKVLPIATRASPDGKTVFAISPTDPANIFAQPVDGRAFQRRLPAIQIGASSISVCHPMACGWRSRARCNCGMSC